MNNKPRVFIALYARPNASSLSSTRSKTPPSTYRWGIWIEPKGSAGDGISYDALSSLAFATTNNAAGWHLSIAPHSAFPADMLGRIMVGKLPEGLEPEDVGALLTHVPLPAGAGLEGEVEWVRVALGEFQRNGCAEIFSIEQFVGDAVGYADGWMAKEKRYQKVNYTWSRTFP